MESQLLLSPGFTMKWRRLEDESPASPDSPEPEEAAAPQDGEGAESATLQPSAPPPTFGRLLRFARPEAPWVIAGLFVLLLRLPFSLAMPHFVSEALGRVLASDQAGVMRNVHLFFYVAVVNAVLDYGNCWLFVIAKQRLERRVRQLLFARLLGRELAFFDTVQTGNLLSRLNNDCSSLGSDLTWLFRWSLENIVRTIGISAYLFVASPRLGLLAITLMPTTAMVNRGYGRRLARAAQEQQEALAGASTVAAEALGAIRTVAAAHGQAYERRRYAAWTGAAMRAGLTEGWLQSVYYALMSSLIQQTVIQGAILLYGAHLVLTSRLDGARLIAVMFYQSQLMSEFSGLLNSLSSLYRTSGAAAKVFELLDAHRHGNAVDVCVQPSAESMQAAVGHVRFDDVHFEYPTRPGVSVLRGVTLDAPPGKTLALVGPSGGGKSTLFHLLEGFYVPTAGSVSLDGINVRAAPLSWLHAAIGLVAQEPVLFSGSIAENILYCSRAQAAASRAQARAAQLPGGDDDDHDCSDGHDEVANSSIVAGRPPGWVQLSENDMHSAEAAAQQAHAHGFVSALPQGYNTQIGERGVQLSGGQRQRLAIARAIHQNPRVLLLDEATNALDTASEQAVQEALAAAAVGRTVLVIAHRLATVTSADEIVVLHRGVVAERGTHTQLLARPWPTEPGAVTYRTLARREDSILQDE